MDSKIVVTADAAGNVIVKSKKNHEYGYMRVEQTRMVIDETGFVRSMKLSALVPGKIADLKSFGWEADQEVNGKIIVKESLEAFNKNKPEQDYKIAGKSGVVCTKDGDPIFRKHFYVLSSQAEDSPVIEHTNGDEITEAYALIKEESSGGNSSKEDFSL